MRNKQAQRGFTLLEMIAVLVILGILATFVAPNVLGSTDDAKITKTKSDINVLRSALDMYRLDNSYYPTTEEGLNALIEKPNSDNAGGWREGGYLSRGKLPVDGWKRDYIYVSPGENGPYDIYSLGRDGSQGGENSDADIGLDN